MLDHELMMAETEPAALGQASPDELPDRSSSFRRALMNWFAAQAIN